MDANARTKFLGEVNQVAAEAVKRPCGQRGVCDPEYNKEFRRVADKLRKQSRWQRLIEQGKADEFEKAVANEVKVPRPPDPVDIHYPWPPSAEEYKEVQFTIDWLTVGDSLLKFFDLLRRQECRDLVRDEPLEFDLDAKEASRYLVKLRDNVLHITLDMHTPRRIVKGLLHIALKELRSPGNSGGKKEYSRTCVYFECNKKYTTTDHRVQYCPEHRERHHRTRSLRLRRDMIAIQKAKKM